MGEFLAGLAVGGTGVWLLCRHQLQWLRDELTTAHDRLYGAWQEKAVIPPRSAVQELEEVAPVPLPDWAYAAILDFTSPQGRQSAEAVIRQGIAAGKSQRTILASMAGTPS